MSASATKESFVIAKTSTGRSSKGKTPFFPLIFDQTRALNTHLHSHSCEYQKVHNSLSALYSP